MIEAWMANYAAWEGRQEKRKKREKQAGRTEGGRKEV
jgi:hypothetical protein